MPKIGILDDRKDELATTKRIIGRNLNDPAWEVVDVPLLASASKVVEWIANNRVQVLVADQVLSDRPSADAGGKTVGYMGHEVVKEIRGRIPNLPVYMITARAGTDDELSASLGKLEEMVPRGDLRKQAPYLVERMKRAGQGFVEKHAEALSRISELSKKRAGAHLTEKERKELNALQMTLDLTAPIESRAGLLPELEKSLQKLDALRKKAEVLLAKKKRRK